MIDETLIAGFNEAVANKDVTTANKYKAGLLYHIAWQANPKLVANMDEAIKAIERGRDPSEWLLSRGDEGQKGTYV